jgi:hypothetical protein
MPDRTSFLKLLLVIIRRVLSFAEPVRGLGQVFGSIHLYLEKKPKIIKIKKNILHMKIYQSKIGLEIDWYTTQAKRQPR